jgi:hypothetical protein
MQAVPRYGNLIFFPCSGLEEHNLYNLLHIGTEYVLAHLKMAKKPVYGVKTMHIV